MADVIVIDRLGALVEQRCHPGDAWSSTLKWNLDGDTPSSSVTITAKVTTEAGEELATVTTSWTTLDATPALACSLTATQTAALWAAVAPRGTFRLRWYVVATRAGVATTEVRGPFVLAPR